MSTMSAIAFLDVAYSDTAAAVAGVLIRSWDARSASKIAVRRFDNAPGSYEPGAFYKRELPLLLAIMSELDDPIEAIVIDGYVWLSADGLPGLGGHLFASLTQRIPVIGIAKSRYRNDTWSIPVLRGASRQPLFVTSAGIEAQQAAECVLSMHGAHRIPTIATLVDSAARDELSRHG